jgi:pimeloyl-ACP methyl ester carboxylesterase
MPRFFALIAVGVSLVLLLAVLPLTIDRKFARQHTRIDPRRAGELAISRGASWEGVAIRASDGVTLQAWLFTPRHSNNGRAVVVVHGGTLNRQYMLDRANLLLKAGYTCLLVDQRGCGDSGGGFTWGMKEPADIAAWSKWLRTRAQATQVFGYGVSRGSTTLIQSLALRPPFDGMALECAGAGNIGHPYEFAADQLGISERWTRMIAWPVIEPSLAWVRYRQGLDLRSVISGEEAVRGSRVPVLLIQGTNDDTTPLVGAERIRDANPESVRLTLVPGVGHDWFHPVKPAVMTRILQWYEAHAKSL